MAFQKIYAMGFNYRTQIDPIESAIKALNSPDGRCRFIFIEGLHQETANAIRFAHERKLPHKVIPPIEFDSNENSAQMEKTLLQLVENTKSGDSYPKTIPLYDFFRSSVSKYFLSDSISNILKYERSVQRLLDSDKPDAVLVPNGQWVWDRVCCALASVRGITTVAAPHYTDQLSILADKINLFLGPSAADRSAVLGSWYRNSLIKAGAAPDRIMITGLPKFNAGASSPSKGNFLLTLQGLPEDELIVSSLIEAMNDFPDNTLIVRPHPLAESQRVADTVKRKRIENIVLAQDQPFDCLLKDCDLLITVSSVTAFQAILYDKPVVILNLASRFYPHIFIKEGAALEVNRKRDIAPTMRKVLSDHETMKMSKLSRQNVIAKYSPGTNIDSTRLICDLFN